MRGRLTGDRAILQRSPAFARAALPGDFRPLRRAVTAAGVGVAALVVIVGLAFRLQTYGDGAIFSYAVAVQDAWAFHWHNIASRSFVYLYAMLPAEAYVGLARDPRGGVVLYGALFFLAPLLGLGATFAADRSRGRAYFTAACASTASLCPLVFGAPTEMWVAHALFWPALAACHCARGRTAGLRVFLLSLALVFTHEGALAFAGLILASLALRGPRDPAFRRTALALAAVVPLWLAVKLALRPDAYTGEVMRRAAWHFFDPTILGGSLMRLIAATLAGYALALLLLRRIVPARAELVAAALAGLALAAWWIGFDGTLHTQNRYYLRTVVFLATPLFGLAAVLVALDAADRVAWRVPGLAEAIAVLGRGAVARAALGALALVLLIHAVETAKFVAGWHGYTAAMRDLATSALSDPALGDARFVSSARIDRERDRLSWFSTTPYLSVLVAPDFAPARLVVDPTANYFWLSCATAHANAAADRALPRASRALVATYSCLHR